MDDAGQGLELALLAAPFSADAPAGSDPRQDFSPQSLYFRLRDARADAREIERRLDHDPDPDTKLPTLWRIVRDLSIKLLAERSKDLEIAAWLTEALVRETGFAGIAVGARLIADLAETFWDAGLHPMPDDDGMATRVAPITGLNGEGGDGTLMQPLRKQVLFVQPDGTPILLWQYKQSEEVEAIADPVRRKQRLTASVASFDSLERGAKAAGGTQLAALRTETKAALAAWTLMSERLDALAGRDAPPTSRVRDLLREVLEIANRYAPPDAQPVAGEGGGDAQDGNKEGVEGAPGPASQGVGQKVSREDMLRELGRIADYFRRTEPHSPLSYTLEEAVRRGRMTLPELLAEIVPDGTVRTAMLVMLGIRPTPPNA